MAEKELQVKPLTESSSLSNWNHFWSDENPKPPIPQNDAFKFWRQTKVFQCCGCVVAILLIIVVTFLIFSFTVYNLKEPQLSLNAVTLFNSNNLSNDSNMTLIAHVYLKNSNVFTLRFGSTTMLFYNQTVIGEGRIPSGKAKAQRTLLLNITVEIVRDKFMIMAHQNFTTHKAINFSCYTIVNGNVKVLNLFDRKVEVAMNCTILYNITAGSIYGHNCLTGDIV